jgi:hypothetical protein
MDALWLLKVDFKSQEDFNKIIVTRDKLVLYIKDSSASVAFIFLQGPQMTQLPKINGLKADLLASEGK